MNGRERIFAALRRQEPDRVPMTEWIIHEDVRRAIVPSGDLGDLVEFLDLDGVTGRAEYDTWDLPDGRQKDEWGVLMARTKETFIPVDGPIKSLADLEKYVPPNPLRPDRLREFETLVKRFKGKRAILFHQHEAWRWTYTLRNLEDALVDMILNPALIEGLVELSVEYNTALMRRAVAAGAEVIMFGDDYAYKNGPMMSPRQFERFFLPGIKRLVQATHDAGAICVKHTDGNIWSLLDYFVEAGFDAINPLEPSADMDIGEVKRRYGDRFCLIGNVDCGWTLTEAAVEEVVEETKKCIRDAAPGGGFILMSSNSIHSKVKPENYVAMVRTGQLYGRYPIEADRPVDLSLVSR